MAEEDKIRKWDFTLLDMLGHAVGIELLESGVVRFTVQHGKIAIGADLNQAMVMSLAVRLLEAYERARGNVPSLDTAAMQAKIADVYQLPEWLRQTWGLPVRKEGQA